MKNLYLGVIFIMVLVYSPYALDDKWFYLCSVPMAMGYVWLADLIAMTIELFLFNGEEDGQDSRES